MDDVEVLAESIIKIEDLKQESNDAEDPAWEPTGRWQPAVTLLLQPKEVKQEVGDEREGELELPAAVFVKAEEIKKEVEEEVEDPVAVCSVDLHAVPVKMEESSLASGVHRRPTRIVPEYPRPTAASPCERLSLELTAARVLRKSKDSRLKIGKALD